MKYLPIDYEGWIRVPISALSYISTYDYEILNALHMHIYEGDEPPYEYIPSQNILNWNKHKNKADFTRFYIKKRKNKFFKNTIC